MKKVCLFNFFFLLLYPVNAYLPHQRNPQAKLVHWWTYRCFVLYLSESRGSQSLLWWLSFPFSNLSLRAWNDFLSFKLWPFRLKLVISMLALHIMRGGFCQLCVASYFHLWYKSLGRDLKGWTSCVVPTLCISAGWIDNWFVLVEDSREMR